MLNTYKKCKSFFEDNPELIQWIGNGVVEHIR